MRCSWSIYGVHLKELRVKGRPTPCETQVNYAVDLEIIKRKVLNNEKVTKYL